ncbi:MAG TPA: hypothetical protein PKV97_00255 [Thauera aminoaromatica]|nr:hypothetical protein [Thauera aminoaromatica]
MTRETAQEWHNQDVAEEELIRGKQLLLVWHETALFHNSWKPDTGLTREEYDAGIARAKAHVPGHVEPRIPPPSTIRLPKPPPAPVPTPPDDPPPATTGEVK